MTQVRSILAAMMLCLASLAPHTSARGAQEWFAAGYSFSDELGGFEILGVSGSGTHDDPIVVEQRFMEVGPAVLVIRPSFAPTGWVDFRNSQFLQVSIVAVVTNASRRGWAGFDMELQEELGQPSVYSDGLSFDQLNSIGGRQFTSDRFALFTDLSEPYDRVRFEQGKVDHGETARFHIHLTDVTPVPEFYLLQEPQILMAGRDVGDGVSFASAKPPTD